MSDMEKEEDILFAMYQRDRILLEEKRADILKKRQAIDAEQSMFDDGHRQMRQWFGKEVAKHCDREALLLAMEDCEDEIDNSFRKMEDELMDEKDRLETEKQKTYTMEEELEAEYRKKRNSLEAEYGIGNEPGIGDQSVRGHE